MSRYQKNPYRGNSFYRSKRFYGISIHEIAFWVDGKGTADRKNGRGYTWVDTVEGSEAHGGQWIETSATSTIALGANNEWISSCWFWLYPTSPDDPTSTVINFDGGTNIITRNFGDIGSTISGARIYVNGILNNETDQPADYFVYVEWDTPIQATNLTIASGLNGKITQLMAFNVKVPLPKVLEFYQDSSDETIPVPTDLDVLLQETGDDLLLETGYDFLLESSGYTPVPSADYVLQETGDLLLKQDGYGIVQES